MSIISRERIQVLGWLGSVFRGVFAHDIAGVQAKLWSNFSVTSLKITIWREATMVQKNTKLS